MNKYVHSRDDISDQSSRVISFKLQAHHKTSASVFRGNMRSRCNHGNCDGWVIYPIIIYPCTKLDLPANIVKMRECAMGMHHQMQNWNLLVRTIVMDRYLGALIQCCMLVSTKRPRCQPHPNHSLWDKG